MEQGPSRGKKVPKSVLTWVVAVTLALGGVPAQSFAVEVQEGRDNPRVADAQAVFRIAQGDIGASGLSWTLDEEGQLVIAGTGTLDCSGSDFSPSPWAAYDDAIESVVVGENVAPGASLARLFYGCSHLKSVSFPDWDTSAVTDLSQMFSGCHSLERVDLSGWDTSHVTDMSALFAGCTSLTSAGVAAWDVAHVTDISQMFSGCSSLASLDLAGWSTKSVVNMSSLFAGCAELESLRLGSAWDTSSVVFLGGAFSGCSSLKALDLSCWDTSRVVNMGSLFGGCTSLEALDVARWDTSSVATLGGLFVGCASLKSIDLSGWSTSSVASAGGLFAGCTSLRSLRFGGGWTWPLEESSLPAGTAWYNAEGKAMVVPWTPASGTYTTQPVSAPSEPEASGPASGGPSTVILASSRATGSKAASKARLKLNRHGVVKLKKKGKTVRLKANLPVRWSSSDKRVAVVSRSGKVRAKRTGFARITARSSNGRVASVLIQVGKPVKVKSVTLYKGKKKLSRKAVLKLAKRGRSVKLTAQVRPSRATAKKVTWKSSNRKVAVVSKSGKIVAGKRGVCKIAASTIEGKRAQVMVKVLR